MRKLGLFTALLAITVPLLSCGKGEAVNASKDQKVLTEYIKASQQYTFELEEIIQRDLDSLSSAFALSSNAELPSSTSEESSSSLQDGSSNSQGSSSESSSTSSSDNGDSSSGTSSTSSSSSGPLYFVTLVNARVVGSTGGNTTALPGQSLQLEALPPTGQCFLQWQSSVASVLSTTTQTPTTLTMPAAIVTITANIGPCGSSSNPSSSSTPSSSSETRFFLVLENAQVAGTGAGSGIRNAGEVLSLESVPVTGQCFLRWETSPSTYAANLSTPALNTTSFTMPAAVTTVTSVWGPCPVSSSTPSSSSSDPLSSSTPLSSAASSSSISSSSSAATTYAVLVDGGILEATGTNNGAFAAGSRVNFSTTPAPGQCFQNWYSQPSVAILNSTTTSAAILSMPASAVNIFAVYTTCVSSSSAVSSSSEVSSSSVSSSSSAESSSSAVSSSSEVSSSSAISSSSAVSSSSSGGSTLIAVTAQGEANGVPILAGVTYQIQYACANADQYYQPPLVVRINSGTWEIFSAALELNDGTIATPESTEQHLFGFSAHWGAHSGSLPTATRDLVTDKAALVFCQ